MSAAGLRLRLRWAGPLAVVALAVGAAVVAGQRGGDSRSAEDPAPAEEELAEVTSDAPRYATLDELVAAADLVVRGEVASTERGRTFGQPGGTTIVSRLVSHQRNAGPLAELTAREREVLALMAEGHSNQGICERLFLSPKTLEGHVGNIFRKLDIGDAPDYHRRVVAVLTFLRAPGLA